MAADAGTAEWNSQWSFGVAPLRQSLAYASAVRSLTETVLALDGPAPQLDLLIEQIGALDRSLREHVATGAKPRIGERAHDRAARPYLDHSIHIGAYNPAFPEYTVDELTPERAAGTICFSPVYEGPPGCAHGGFVAVFFDVVTGHQSSQVGLAGKTKSLEIRYRRPTPLGVELHYTVERRVEEREIVSEVALSDGPTLLCTGVARAVAGRLADLAPVGERLPAG
jgi:hypothetical protein